MTTYIDRDGFLNVAEIVALAKSISKVATKGNWKATEIHYTGKGIPKFDAQKMEANKELWFKKRAQVVKMRKRMPTAGARVKMVTLLTLYTELEDTEFAKPVALALKAIATHNSKTEKTVEQLKGIATKRKTKNAVVFDANVDELQTLLLKAGIAKNNIAIGETRMGKAVIVKLASGYVTIGQATAERFAGLRNPVEPGVKAKPASRVKATPEVKTVTKKTC